MYLSQFHVNVLAQGLEEHAQSSKSRGKSGARELNGRETSKIDTPKIDFKYCSREFVFLGGNTMGQKGKLNFEPQKQISRRRFGSWLSQTSEIGDAKIDFKNSCRE